MDDTYIICSKSSNLPTCGMQKGFSWTFSSTCPKTVDGTSNLKMELLHINFVSKSLEESLKKLSESISHSNRYFANNPWAHSLNSS